MSDRPSTPFKWADDDEDDFDFESWKATADTSMPCIAELGPLQYLSAEEEIDLLFHTSGSESSEDSNTVSSEEHDAAPPLELPKSQEVLDNEAAEAHQCTAFYSLNREPDRPTYPEMSFYPDRSCSPEVRVNYASNWKQYKVDSRLDRRREMLFRPSKLRHVAHVDDEDPLDIKDDEDFGLDFDLDAEVEKMLARQMKADIEELEEFSEIDLNELPQVLEDEQEECAEAVDDAQAEFEIVAEALKVETPVKADSSETDFDFCDLFEDDQASGTDNELEQDEGYHSISPSTSPPPTHNKTERFPSCPLFPHESSLAPPFMQCKRTRRHNSLGLLLNFKKECRDVVAVAHAIDGDEVSDQEPSMLPVVCNVVDIPASSPPCRTPIPQLDNYKPSEYSSATSGPKVVGHLPGPASKDWCYFTIVPWVAAFVGAAVSGIVCLLRWW